MALNPNIGWHPPTRTRQPATGPQAQYRWPSEVRILSCSLLHSALPSGASGKVLKGAETGSNQVVTYSRGSVISGPRVTPPRTAASASGSDFSVTLPWVAEGAGLAALAGPDDVVRTSIVSADVDCRPALMIAGTKNSATPTMATTAAAAIPRMRLLRRPVDFGWAERRESPSQGSAACCPLDSIRHLSAWSSLPGVTEVASIQPANAPGV